MNTLPLDCLVANFLACEGRFDSPPAPDEENVYPMPLDDTHHLGVTMSPSGRSLIFFGHPGAGADPGGPPPADESSEAVSDELEVGDDIDGRWTLTADRSSGRHTLWVRVEHQRVGHAEFARIIDNLRWRFAVWHEVLADWNESATVVTQGVPIFELQERHGSHASILSLEDSEARKG